MTSKRAEKQRIIPVFLPAVSCPGHCVFCDQKAISGIQSVPSPEKVAEIVGKGIDCAGLNGSSLREIHKLPGNIEVAFYGGSFTSAPRDLQESWVRAARQVIPEVPVRVSARPDRLGAEERAMLKKLAVQTVEVGCQSMDDSVLTLSGRGHDSAAIVNAVRGLLDESFTVGVQMMTGLPGQSMASAIETGKKLSDLNPHFARIYPVLVLSGTALEKMWKSGDYEPPTLDETVDTVARIFSIFRRRDIPVIRMGLHGETEFTESSVLAGPFHQSFGELVYSRIFGGAILKFIQSRQLTSGDLSVKVHETSFSRACGFRKSNRILLGHREFNLLVQTDNEIGPWEMVISFSRNHPNGGTTDFSLEKTSCKINVHEFN
ncbi:MAG: hypothetical protein CVV64_03015 [Candidatus Wallbacteria bacterium HGW-Wallbacteria-1]|jgi:histone acetyltransferase (RNA polymerase elongator complex component)|uniref:Radical SAM core domain-containing protein n=1 Tax=Candidatus Wallbacteria bacterium HGW-Wallbacteria-1 TaxID=2013854 RepID=A0A2N1PTQ4_9BACT|nr:MAG: hypothetical protein CVV64_03015 [Candidatus Wallbacteria bacterium HGW-Wallbacteria-1]